MFKDGEIDGVVVRNLKRHTDERGWLMEIFRSDELPEEYIPVMAYTSITRPGVVRGPHEHTDQADLFCFAGPSDFKVYLWDNRQRSKTYRNRLVLTAGESSPKVLIIPKKVVHAYKNVGERDGLVINCPNRLFMGRGRSGPVDEVRYEDDDTSPYKVD
jgi:dTDP-4-dehydrorhamnose 3,5-epimerase